MRWGVVVSGLLRGCVGSGLDRVSGRRRLVRRMASLWEKETSSLNLGKGHPKPTLLNAEVVAEALVAVSERKGGTVKMMQYGGGKGPENMCKGVVKWMREWGRERDFGEERILVTSGASSALDMICGAFTSPGDVVIVEKPAYFLAYGTLKDHGLKVVEVETDDGGLCVDALERELAAGTRPSLLYTVPICNNPKGTSMSVERAAKLVALSRKYSFKIASDEVYFFLQFEPRVARSLAEEDDPTNPTVFAMHSVSKTLGPGTRVGWIDTHPQLLARLLSLGPIVSGGCTSHFMATVVGELIESGKQAQLLEKFRASYELGARALTSALDEVLPAILPHEKMRYIPPAGGYFVWLELPQTVNANELVKSAEEKHGVFFFAGKAFSVDGKDFSNCIRLCFAMLEPDDIREAVRRLAESIKDYLELKAVGANGAETA